MSLVAIRAHTLEESGAHISHGLVADVAVEGKPGLMPSSLPLPRPTGAMSAASGPLHSAYQKAETPYALKGIVPHDTV